MAALTYAQQKKEEEARREALAALEELLKSKERKDMLEDARVKLCGPNPHPGVGTLYLTRRGLLGNDRRPFTDIDGSTQWSGGDCNVRPSLEIVEWHDLTVAEIQDVKKRLKA